MGVRLVAFDLDGTLIRGETCVEAIARTIGRREECAAFEQLAMRDIAGVTAARETMAAWYRSCSPDELVSGLSGLVLAPGAEDAFALLRSRGVATAIVSITWSFAVEWVGRLLGADYTYGTRLTPTEIEHAWPEAKGAWLTDQAAQLGLNPTQVAAVGDSDGDRELLEAAGRRFFVGLDPLDLAGLVHLPGGDMLDIAHRIVV